MQVQVKLNKAEIEDIIQKHIEDKTGKKGLSITFHVIQGGDQRDPFSVVNGATIVLEV